MIRTTSLHGIKKTAFLFFVIGFGIGPGQEKNKKRVFIKEVEELLKYSLRAKRITRGDFQKYCPRTLSDGSCGFAVIIRVLEHFHIVDITGGEYIVKSDEKIQELLTNQ